MKKFVALALILAGVVLFQFASDFENAFSEPPPAVEEPLPEKAFVYVTGAVKNPGLYALETGKTAGEAVEAAARRNDDESAAVPAGMGQAQGPDRGIPRQVPCHPDQPAQAPRRPGPRWRKCGTCRSA